LAFSSSLSPPLPCSFKVFLPNLCKSLQGDENDDEKTVEKGEAGCLGNWTKMLADGVRTNASWVFSDLYEPGKSQQEQEKNEHLRLGFTAERREMLSKRSSLAIPGFTCTAYRQIHITASFLGVEKRCSPPKPLSSLTYRKL